LSEDAHWHDKIVTWRVAEIGIAAVLTATVAAVSPAQAGDWIADVKTGCQVWNPNPQLEETAVWSGQCNNGRAEGAGNIRWIRNGVTVETDEGEWRDGRQTGRGTQLWGSGRYIGEIADGEPEGSGVLTLRDLRYEGEFQHGRPNGGGTLTAKGETVIGVWKDGCLQGKRRAAVGIPLSACR
jgi:hypothetical protein